MREIKFRAWDKTEKEMARSVNEMRFNSKGLYGLKVNHLGFEFKRRRKDVVLMQYTGLKDKNGVEIYEGDVVMAEHPHLYASYLGLVSITPGDGLYIEYTDGHVDFGLDEIQYKKYIGVIGNIYENPDILEGLR